MRLFSGVVRALDLVPCTPLGLLAAMGSYGLLRWLAYGRLDLVLLVVGYAVVALTGLCALLVCAAATALKLGSGRRPADDAPRKLVLETGVALRTGFSLPSLQFVPLTRVRWDWVQPAGPQVQLVSQGGRLWEAVSMHDRGEFGEVTRRVVVEDVLGLCRIAIRMREQVSFDVLPALGALRHTSQLSSMAGGDALPHPMGIAEGDRTELQRYVPGDPARFIHWKVFGRTRRLMVRAPERALALSHRTAAFIAAGPGDDASAAVARLALERQMLGTDWRFGSDANVAGTSRLDEALTVLMRSSEARGRGGTGLNAFLREAEKQGPAAALVFAPPAAGSWMPNLLRVARLRHVRVVIGIDGVAKHAPRPLWRSLVSFAQPQAGTPTEELNRVIRALGGGNCEVIVMDRKTGRLLSRDHLRLAEN